jgi:hypothetical protein
MLPVEWTTYIRATTMFGPEILNRNCNRRVHVHPNRREKKGNSAPWENKKYTCTNNTSLSLLISVRNLGLDTRYDQSQPRGSEKRPRYRLTLVKKDATTEATDHSAMCPYPSAHQSADTS